LALNDYVAGDGPALFAQACAMGLEGIVSKRRTSPYRSGCSPHWLKGEEPGEPGGTTRGVRVHHPSIR
jgi:ATP-dependent DNA ligase